MRSVAAVVALGLLSSACADEPVNYQRLAIQFIERDLSPRIGAPLTGATCAEGNAQRRSGESFPCTARLNGSRVLLEARVVDHGRVAVDPLNVITPKTLGEIRASAITVLQKQTGQRVAMENLDCGSAPIVFEPTSPVLACQVRLVGSAVTSVAHVTVHDLTDITNVSVDVG